MSVSRNYRFQLWFFCFISFQNVSGVQINLTRTQAGDYFNNPYEDDKFCLLTNSICYKNLHENGEKCRYCKCNESETTFNLTNLRCVPNEVSLNKGKCTLNFGGKYRQISKLYLPGFDLTKSGTAKINIPQLPSGWRRKLQNCAVNEVAQINSKGYEIISSQTFSIWSVDWISKTFRLIWSTPNKDQLPIQGRVFRITFRCEHRKPGPGNGEIIDCIMLKSNGTVQIDHPGLREATSSSVVETTAKVKETKTTRKSKEPSSWTVESSRTGPTAAARNNDGSERGNNVVTVSLAVVGCLLLLGVVAMVVLWLRRRSARTSKDKNTEICLTNGNVEPESVYAEVGSSIDSSVNGDVSHEYDYADGNLRNYASLDMTKFESKSIYQSLINVQKDSHEYTPSEGGEKSIAEPFYHVVEGAEEAQECQDPGQIYHVLEEPGKTDNCKTEDAPGRTGNENPVYSTLEEENVPENCDREVPEGTGDDNPERVYSVLENENAESDMTTQQATSNYEQRG